MANHQQHPVAKKIKREKSFNEDNSRF